LRLKVREIVEFSFPSTAEFLTPRHLLSQGSTDLDHIQIIKKVGGKLTDSYLDEGEGVFHIPVASTLNVSPRFPRFHP
jgi:hypothetical protein